MKVVILQHNIVWANPMENQARLEQEIDRQPGADLYVLAEMWSTGYAPKPEDVAERDGASLQWMQRMAGKYNAAIAGSIAVEENGEFRNRLYFVKPDGSVEYYDKRHLFTYGGEHLQFTRGEHRVVVEWRGVRFLLEICYDLRFPVWSRNCGDYDAILYVASWPTPRIEAWRTLLRARAIENQCYVIGGNRVGEDPNCKYCGCSAIIDPYGRTLAECERDEECRAESLIDTEALTAFREKFPVLRDRDDYTIRGI